jgi:cell division septation protein DedD
MKLAFLALLLVNLALFAWQRGVFGPIAEAGREPQRVTRQIEPEKIRVLTPEQLAALRSTATPPSGSNASKPACVEFGDFDDANVARVQARLAALSLGERLQVRRIEGPGWYIVYLPPLASRAEAERTVQDLRGRGIRDVVVMGENSSMPNAILLGSFRDQDLAQRHQADLTRRGFKGVQLSERPSTAATTRFEIREVDPPLAQQLAEIQKEFPQSQLGTCTR